MTRLLTYNEIDRTEWSRLVRESATGTWFQTPEAFDFLMSMPQLFKPFCIAVAEQTISDERFAMKGVCVGYMTVEKPAIRQYFTRRAILLGGPCLADDATNEEVGMLMDAVRKQWKNGPIYIETRNFNDYSRWKDAFEQSGFNYRPHLNFHVDCTDKEVMWERLSENRRRQIKKISASNACSMSCEQGLLNEPLSRNDEVTEQDIREWYAILAELYRTKVKTPLWPVEFFLEAYRQGIGKFMLVKHEGKVIGGSMVVVFTGKEKSDSAHEGAVYEWFECGLNNEYKEQYPSVKATWKGMEYANAHACARYDMMGAGMPGVPYGVRDFKSEFGGKLVEQGRFLCICKPILYQIGVMGVKCIRKFSA